MSHHTPLVRPSVWLVVVVGEKIVVAHNRNYYDSQPFVLPDSPTSSNGRVVAHPVRPPRQCPTKMMICILWCGCLFISAAWSWVNAASTTGKKMAAWWWIVVCGLRLLLLLLDAMCRNYSNWFSQRRKILPADAMTVGKWWRWGWVVLWWLNAKTKTAVDSG